MKRILFISGISLIIMSGLLSQGCSNSYETVTFPVLPKELEDCKFYYVTNDKGTKITVVRCPNSTTSTTYKSGKTNITTLVVDG